jgi:hypothetical protein
MLEQRRSKTEDRHHEMVASGRRITIRSLPVRLCGAGRADGAWRL